MTAKQLAFDFDSELLCQGFALPQGARTPTGSNWTTTSEEPKPFTEQDAEAIVIEVFGPWRER